MPTSLELLIEKARKHQMTPSEREAQVRSFAYGNAHFENAAITRADVGRAVDTLKSEKALFLQVESGSA